MVQKVVPITRISQPGGLMATEGGQIVKPASCLSSSVKE